MKFKKVLLIASLLSTTALAETENLYVRLKLSQLHPHKINNLDAKPVTLPGFAVGYNITDDMRVDISVSHLSNVRHRGAITESTQAPVSLPPSYAEALKEDNLLPPSYDTVECEPIFTHKIKSISTTAKLTTVKANLFVDLYKYKGVSLYVGGGIGGTRIQRSITIDGVTTKTNPYCTPAYDIHTGVNFAINHDTTLGLGYTFKNLTENTYNYKGHSIATSIKLDL